MECCFVEYSLGIFQILTIKKALQNLPFVVFKKNFLKIFLTEVILHFKTYDLAHVNYTLKYLENNFKACYLMYDKIQYLMVHLFCISSECLHVYVLSVDNCVSC